MNSTKWLLDLRAAVQKGVRKTGPTAKYVQLATVKQDGRPSCRTVVFRGFGMRDEAQSGTGRYEDAWFRFITDRRSDKIGELAANSWAEVCWYFVHSREQFRITGELAVVTEDEKDDILLDARTQQWLKLSDSAREQFFSQNPGVPITLEDNEADRDSSALPKNNIAPSFCLLLLKPVQVDHVLLKPPARFSHVATDSACLDWTTTELNP